MATLLLRLVGPMQSWGIQSHFTNRDTGLEPSKSGVMGLLCAALGKPRDERDPANLGKPTVAELAKLRMGVRVDREGLMKRDYHTAMNVLQAKGGIKTTEVSHRFYLADAAFLVGLEGDLDLLTLLDKRISRPVWMLYLGRKSFVTSEPVWLKDTGLRHSLSLDEALIDSPDRYPRIANQQIGFDEDRVRLVIEDSRGTLVRNDQPITYHRPSMTQHCTIRRLRMEWRTFEPIRSNT